MNARDSIHLAKVIRDHIATAILAMVPSLALAACTHDPLDVACPDIRAGDLVLTEIRGSQSNDTYGEWVEVYNASEQSIDLSGLSVAFIKLDGSTQSALLVRSEVVLAAGEYGVLGRQVPGAEPAYVDYGYIDDIDRKLYDTAAVDIRSCGERIDLVVYRNLPSKGTLALDGSINPPSAQANDDEISWCVDSTEDAMSETAGIRGTPQEGNPVCPEE